MKQLIRRWLLSGVCLLFAFNGAGSNKQLADRYVKMATDPEKQMNAAYSDSLLQRALNIYSDLDLPHQVIQCYNHLLISAFNRGNNYKAREYANKAMIVAKKSKVTEDIAIAYSNLSVVNSRMGDYEKANEYNFMALRLFKQSDNQQQIARCNLSIGTVYIRLKEYQKALSYISQARDVFYRIKDLKGYSICVSNIGSIYMELNENKKALPCFFEAVQIDEQGKDQDGTSSNFSNIGLVYYNLGNYSSAMKYYVKALEIDKRTGDISGIANLYLNISKLLAAENKLDQALTYVISSLEYFRETGELTNKQKALEHLASIYEQSGNHEKAFRTYRDAMELKDSLFDIDKATKIAMLEEKYINEKLANENLSLKFRNDLQKKELSWQLKLSFTYLAALILTIIAILIIVIQFRAKNKAYTFIVKKNLELMNKEKELGSIKVELKTMMEVDKNKPVISEDEKEKLLVKLEKSITIDRIYTRTDLTVEKLAKRLATNRTYLSQVINEVYHKNYSDFINEYRVHEAMLMLSDPVTGSRYSIDAIAKEAGFNTISNFNTVFKKYTGIAPSVFRKEAENQFHTP